MPIDPHVAESLAVSYGEEDFCGPYELIWGLTTHYPNELPQERRAAAEAALRRLFENGLIQLHRCDTQVPYEAPIPADRAIAVLSEPTFWLTPAELGKPPFYWFATTAAGEQALTDGIFKSL